MNDSDINVYVQKLIEPLYLKIQQLEKENNDLKKRVGCLQSQIMTQSTRTYMKNTASREHHMQQSTISRREDENRSVSGGKQKPAWKSITKIQQPKPVLRESPHHQKIKLKPPIPRMSSKTPTKTTELIAREKSPGMEKKITGGIKVEADKKQNTSQIHPIPTKILPVNTPTKTKLVQKDLEDTPSSKISKTNSIQIGKPNIYIQKESKLNTITNSPIQTPSLQRSSLTEKADSKTTGTAPGSDLEKITKSQLSIK